MSRLGKRTSRRRISRPNMRKALSRMEEELIALVRGAQGLQDPQLVQLDPEKRALWHWFLVKQELLHAYDIHFKRRHHGAAGRK